MRNKLKNFVYEKETQTIRCKPENYWIASVKDGKVIFDSWDGAIVGRYSKKEVLAFYQAI